MRQRKIVPIRKCGNEIKCWRCGKLFSGSVIDMISECPRGEKNNYVDEKKLYVQDVDSCRQLELLQPEVTKRIS
jgi:hypothetical protein